MVKIPFVDAPIVRIVSRVLGVLGVHGGRSQPFLGTIPRTRFGVFLLLTTYKPSSPHPPPLGRYGRHWSFTHRTGRLAQNGISRYVWYSSVKDAIGDRLCFWGAIDQQGMLPRGSDQELEADIIDKMNCLGTGKGYVIAPAHIIQSDVSPECVEKFISLCLEHGRLYE